MKNPAIWVLADPLPGHANQALGVAEALGLPFAVKKLDYGIASKLPNLMWGASFAGLTAAAKKELTPPWPDLIIACGRKSAPAARAIKKKSEGRTRLVQILDPGRAGREDFDLVAIPHHDAAAGAARNLLRIAGAPHRVTPEKLADAAEAWRGRFADLPRPWIALIVGGATRKKSFTPGMAADLGAKAAQMAGAAGGSLLITTSRRTGEEAEAALFAAIGGPNFRYSWQDGGANPYFGFLALADAILVTGDSVSMISEACAGTKPVYIFAPGGMVGAKHARLHQELYRLGLARPLEGKFEPWTHPPLNAAQDVARAIKEKILR